MARVRVDQGAVEDLFRPGGSVEPLDRTDRSGRTRFNLDTGLAFADRAMQSPALGVVGNLAARGISALGHAGDTSNGQPDLSALRQQAAARLAGGQTPPAAAIVAPGAQGPMSGMPSDPAAQLEWAKKGVAERAAAAANRMAPLEQAAASARSAAAAQGPYQFGSSPNMQHLPQGAAPFSMDFEHAARDAQQQGQPERPPIVDLHRPFISEDDIKRHQELRKHLSTAASPAEVIRIAHEMQLHQDNMAARPHMATEARNAAGNWAQQYLAPQAPAAAAPAAAAPPAAEPEVIMANTPMGPLPVVRTANGLVAQHPENGNTLYITMGADGKPHIQQYTPDEMAQHAQAAAQEPNPAEQANTTARERAAELLRGARPVAAGAAPTAASAPTEPDEFGRSPDQVATAKQRAADLMHAPTAQRGPMDRDQLLAMAAQARTREQQADVLRRVPDVDVWGTTLGDIFTGSHQAKGQFLKQLHEVMPGVHEAKTPEELAHLTAQTGLANAQRDYYAGAKTQDVASRINDRLNTMAERIRRNKAGEGLSGDRNTIGGMRANTDANRAAADETYKKALAKIGGDKVDANISQFADKMKFLKDKWRDIKNNPRLAGGVHVSVINKEGLQAAKDFGELAHDYLHQHEGQVLAAKSALGKLPSKRVPPAEPKIEPLTDKEARSVDAEEIAKDRLAAFEKRHDTWFKSADAIELDNAKVDSQQAILQDLTEDMDPSKRPNSAYNKYNRELEGSKNVFRDIPGFKRAQPTGATKPGATTPEVKK